ncbi:MAG: hypothetical protein ACREGH_03265, partial [Minisyncoccia bacterium]
IAPHIKTHVLEDHRPGVAKRVHGTGYLIGNHFFQSFLRSRREKPRLMLNTINDKSVRDLEALGIGFLSNHPQTHESVMTKGEFRKLVKELSLPTLPSTTQSRQNFLNTSFEELGNLLGGSFVVQRADKEVGGNEGTFFIHSETDLQTCQERLAADDTFGQVIATRFIDGYSTSMLGCIMLQGVLTGPLQLQLIDVPESLNGLTPNGIFFGNDLGFRPWDASVEAAAQEVVEKIGAHMAGQGYKGIFGIDFLYDKQTGEIFPNECNPRAPGSVTLYSLALLEEGVPPLEFFHLMSHLDISSSFDFDTVNRALKIRRPCAHIAFSPKGTPTMELPLVAGVYAFDEDAQEPLTYKGPGISLADIKNEKEFIIIDTVPKLGDSIEQNVPRFFKFIFPYSIAKSSHEIEARAAYLVQRFAQTLREAAEQKTTPHTEGLE